MKNKKISAALTALLLAAGMVPFYSFTPSAQPVSALSENDLSENELPEWVPYDVRTAIDFLNTYGVTHVQDGYVCIVVKNCSSLHDNNISDPQCIFTVSSEESQEILHGVSEKFTVYVCKATTGFWVNVNDETYYQFDFTDEKITQTDIFGWLPDCSTEFRKFKEENGELSAKDGNIYFLDNGNPSTGYSWILTSGSESVKETENIDCSFVRKISEMGTGEASNVIRVFKPVADGLIDLEFTYARPWNIEETTLFKVNKTFRSERSGTVTEELSETPDDVINAVYDNTEYNMFGSYEMNFSKVEKALENPSAVITGTEELKSYLADYMPDEIAEPYMEKYNDEFFDENVLLLNAYKGLYGPEKYRPVSAQYCGNDIKVKYTVESWGYLCNSTFLNIMQVYFPKKYFHADNVCWESESVGTPGAVRVTVLDYDTGKTPDDIFKDQYPDERNAAIYLSTNFVMNNAVTGPILSVNEPVSVHKVPVSADTVSYDIYCDYAPEGYCLPYGCMKVEKHSNYSADVTLRLKKESACDISGDGVFNAADLIAFEKIFLGEKNTFNEEAADINCDGKINIADLCILKDLLTAPY